MKTFTSVINRLLLICLIIILNSIISSANAQQQQYANAYTYWDFGQGSDDVQNVEQKYGLRNLHPLRNG